MSYEGLPSLAKLLRTLQQVPYLASKNVYRVAHYFLDMDEQRFDQFIKTFQEVKKDLIKCHRCFAWQERSGACHFCDDAARDNVTLCVVEKWHDLYAIEKTGGYRGQYHVLGGAISPLEGISPQDITIQQLVARLSLGYKELILALNPTPEGEATAAYLVRLIKGSQLENNEIKITCLSRGMPVGASLESVDRVTVFKALADRRLF